MPFRPSFDCLWCGTAHAVRDPADIEGWAQLCPSCVARAGANPFLRTRLKAGLAARAGALAVGTGPAGPVGQAPGTLEAAGQAAGASRVPAAGLGGMTASPPPPGPDRAAPGSSPFTPGAAPGLQDDFYLRRGAFQRGPIHDTAWQAELDAAGRWLDGVGLRGDVVELAAGTGWWSALLAGQATLTVLDESPAHLERARERLIAHRLRAHLHPRDRWAAPDRQVDGVLVGPAVAAVPSQRLTAFAALLHAWLRPGGALALMDLLPDGVLDAGGSPVLRPHEPAALPAALAAAGFTAIQAGSTGRCFALVRATA